jgi:hypothetical protein
MNKQNYLIPLTWVALTGSLLAAEHDYYKYLRYPKGLVPGVGIDKVEQEGGHNAVGYQRRTVEWWPRKGQDVVDIPEGVPLRTWTRNKGQEDKEALAGLCRSWTASDPETFKAHLIGFRSIGTSTILAESKSAQYLCPAAILRMENGEQRAIIRPEGLSGMVSAGDDAYIHKQWEEAFPKLCATISPESHVAREHVDMPLRLWEAERPKFHAIDRGKDAEYPQWGRKDPTLLFNTQHFHIIANPNIWGGTWGTPTKWIRPDDIKGQDLYRKHVFEFAENMWAYIEAAGGCMPFWGEPGPNYKWIIQVRGGGSAGGWMHCGIGDAAPVALAHEFGMPIGIWGGYFLFTQGNATQHLVMPGELQMFSGNFCYPWRNVNRASYQSSLWEFVLGDNPNWGYGVPVVFGGMGSAVEWTPYHTVARLGQQKGLWKNGVRGFGDFFGEYAARMVTVDLVEQPMFRSKCGMPELSYVYPVCGHRNRYRISNAEAPTWCGYNIIRLIPEEGAREIVIDFQGIEDPDLHSDWRACIVAMDDGGSGSSGASGRARYSPMWNKGKMRFELKPGDKRLWLTVAGTPSAFPIAGPQPPEMEWHFNGVHAPRYPWEATMTGCRPGAPHRMQGDVENFDELHAINNENKFVDYPAKYDVPIPLADKDGPLAQEKLAAMQPRIRAAVNAVQEKITAGAYKKDEWWVQRKMNILDDLTTRVDFLQRNAKGHRHPNGGGFVSDNAHVAATAYVGRDAMVLDGARVEGNACIKEFAVVLGPKAVISDHAKISGRAWVQGDIKVGGNARILEGATVTTIRRTRGRTFEGQAEITGNAVIKGDPFLYLAYATNQTITGSLVVDYGAVVNNKSGGVFDCGRFYRENSRFDKAGGLGGGSNDGALYANWQFNQPKSAMLEDAYVNNNGILCGRPEFAADGDHRCIVFNGKDQYAEAPPSVADFGELTIDMLVNRSSGDGRVFDFGTGDDECFYLAFSGGNGKLVLAATHNGKNHSLNASEGIPAGKWVRVRVEMDGSTASIHIDGKQAAKEAFAFHPRDVFIGDRPEGNFIACGRNRNEFFNGRMDHFRIYRKVHDDFAALGPTPAPLTQIPELSGTDKELAEAAKIHALQQKFIYHTTADWEGRTLGEVDGTATPKLKKWLKDVRGD